MLMHVLPQILFYEFVVSARAYAAIVKLNSKSHGAPVPRVRNSTMTSNTSSLCMRNIGVFGVSQCL
ncbi:hypothetical protein FOXYSP1_04917 [Fusarium oxysporum f. sp. phaseoli]